MTTPRYDRRVIKIKAEDSPNVRYALSQEANGGVANSVQVIPGVLAYDLYRHRRRSWDKIRQCVGLDAEFYEGGEVLMYPPDWLNHAEKVARDNPDRVRRHLRSYMGVDPAEGGDNSTWAVVDKLGLKKLVAIRTPDTVEIVNTTLGLMREFFIAPEDVCFDRGGGGTQHVDRLRKEGYNVNTVAFGETVSPDPRRITPGVSKRKEEREEAYAFKNRRAQMYFLVRLLIDTSENPTGWGIPGEYEELRHQLSAIPLKYDGEGRIYLLSKHKRSDNDKQPSLVDIIGHSPDEADALALAVYSMCGKPGKKRVGVVNL